MGGLLRNLLAATTNRLTLTVGGAPATLMPTRELAPGSAQEVAVRALADGKLEVIATGVHMASNDDGDQVPHAFTLRRVYAKASALDAALVVMAPAITPTLSGSYLFDGRDYDPDTGDPTGNTARYRNGIKTNSTVVAQRLGGVIGASNKSRVMGVDGEQNVVDGNIVQGVLRADLDAIFDEAFTYSGSNRTDLTSSTYTSTSTVYGSETTPRIVVRDGDLLVKGNLRGTGVLVINGNLTTSGSGRINWDGVVMARKDTDDNTAADNLTFTLGSNSNITGSLALIQRSSAFVMPFNARLNVFYEFSSAGIQSSVNIEHSKAGKITTGEVAAKGSNRTGGVSVDYTTDLEAGQQLNFFIGAYYPSNFVTTLLRNTLGYRHYARGHFSGGSNPKPYGITTAHPDNPYQWYMAFEDIDTDLNIGFGITPDWDYDVPGQEDQKIRIALQCRAYNTNGTLKKTGSTQVWENCTPENPDTQRDDVALSWTGLTSSSGVVSAPHYGGMLNFNATNANVKYSSASIARLAPYLNTIRTQSQLVMLSSWTSR